MEVNDILNNQNNQYFGHGTGTEDEEIIQSIMNNGLRCSHGSLYFTSVSLGMGKQILDSEQEMLKKWPHKESKIIIIVSLPLEYKIMDVGGTYNKGDAAYYYTPSEETRERCSLTDSPYVMPEFIVGYYDSRTDSFTQNPKYYENLSQNEQTNLFNQVKANYYNIIDEGWDIEEYKEVAQALGWSFGLTDEEITKFKRNKGENEISQQLDIHALIKTINPDLMEKKMKLPNGEELPAKQYIQEIVYPHLPQNGVIILSNGSILDINQFIEEGVIFECQEKYNGDFPRYMAEKTRNNLGVLSIGNEEKKYEISSVEITDYINPSVLAKRVKLPNGIEMPAKQYIQEVYAPHIPTDGRVTLSNGAEISVKQYIEEILLGIGQAKYNGDINQILYNTTRNNTGIVNSNPKKKEATLMELRQQKETLNMQSTMESGTKR